MVTNKTKIHSPLGECTVDLPKGESSYSSHT